MTSLGYGYFALVPAAQKICCLSCSNVSTLTVSWLHTVAGGWILACQPHMILSASSPSGNIVYQLFLCSISTVSLIYFVGYTGGHWMTTFGIRWWRQLTLPPHQGVIVTSYTLSVLLGLWVRINFNIGVASLISSKNWLGPLLCRWSTSLITTVIVTSSLSVFIRASPIILLMASISPF